MLTLKTVYIFVVTCMVCDTIFPESVDLMTPVNFVYVL